PRQLDAEDAQRDEQTDSGEPECEHELGAPALLQRLVGDLPPQEDEADERGRADDEHRGEIRGALHGPAERPRGRRDERRDDERGHRDPKRPHGPRVRFEPWTEPATTTPATTTSSSFSVIASASTRTTFASA